MALGNGVLYAGGSFSSAGGLRRKNAAAFDTLTGAVTAWDPGARGEVYTLAVGHDAIFAAGGFDRIGGQSRFLVAALDPFTGSAMPWDAHSDGVVFSLLLSDTTIYMGGAFTQIGGALRHDVAALSIRTGQALLWNPDVGGPPYSRVMALAMDQQAVYIGGGFARVGGVERNNLAAVDRANGALLPWNPDPNPDGWVWGLAACDDAVYAAGGFSRMGLAVASGLAAMSPPLPLVEPAMLASAQAEAAMLTSGSLNFSIYPNPIRSIGVIRFGLPVATRVKLDIYDLQGRRVANLLDDQPETGGNHQVAVSTSSWPAGCYLYRLQAGSTVLTRRMVVVR
jgi:hypothetical protein